MGYSQAGFTEIVGVDIVAQPNYPFDFVQADALNPPLRLEDFDLIHASPPCQAYSIATTGSTRTHPELVDPTRDLLTRFSHVIENVPGAPIYKTIELCGSMFGLRSGEWHLRRHRLFELSPDFPFFLVPPHNHLVGKIASVVGSLSRTTRRTHAPGHKANGMRAGFDDAKQMMGVEWMSTRNGGHEIAEAIPPAYTEFIGEQFLTQHG